MSIEEENKISLKVYIDTRIDAIKNGIQNTSQQLDKRLDAMNEFRQQLNDQTRSFINRSEHETLLERVNKNENKISNLEGRQYAISVAFAIISIGVSIALHFLK